MNKTLLLANIEIKMRQVTWFGEVEYQTWITWQMSRNSNSTGLTGRVDKVTFDLFYSWQGMTSSTYGYTTVVKLENSWNWFKLSLI